MIIDDIALTFVHGLGIKGCRLLLDIFGSARAIFDASDDELQLRGGVARKSMLWGALHSADPWREAEKVLKHAERYNIKPLASTDPAYPRLLAEIPDAPHVIYTQGNIENLHRPSLSVVGTRNMTTYGQRMGIRVVEQLHELVPEVSIVSGLAFGNDGNAHRAALGCGAATVAVIANALPDVTPTEHRTLADLILRDGGTIITEVSSQTKNNGRFFIPRNRIIAGLSSGTLVVESPYGGGSLQTVDFALDYGRIAMALPGRADDKNSFGSNIYIKQLKAAMVCSGSDVVHELGWDAVACGEGPDKEVAAPVVAAVETVNLSSDERQVYDAMGVGEAVDYDTLVERSGLPVQQVMSLIMGLELAGVVRILPGKRVERV